MSKKIISLADHERVQANRLQRCMVCKKMIVAAAYREHMVNEHPRWPGSLDDQVIR